MQPMLKKLITITAMFIGAFSAFAGDVPLDKVALVKSIGEVETGGQYWRIGAAGERSTYQIKSSTWYRHSKVPFWRASQKSYQAEAARVASCYIDELQQDVDRDGRSITAKNIALRWNAGPNRTNFRAKTISYANRVSNLYVVYKEQEPQNVPVQAAAPIKIQITLSIDGVAPVVFTPPVKSNHITILPELTFYLPIATVL